MATPDPYVSNDIKRRGLNPGLFARTGAAPPRVLPQATESGVDTTAPVPTTRDAVLAGPTRPVDVIDASASAHPASPLDSNAPLPAGVRLRSGTPGTNDVIYEGRGRFGERAFGNNQFNVDGRVRGVNPGLDALTDSRSQEITRSVNAQNAAAARAAQAAATAPTNAKDYTDRIKAESDIAAQKVDTRAKSVIGALDAQSKANANVGNDYFTQVANSARDEALKAGADPATAQAQGESAAAVLAANAGLDPSDPTLPPTARAGATAVRSQLVDLVNGGYPTNFIPSFGSGKATDAADFGDYSLSEPQTSLAGARELTGPADEHGVRRKVRISDRDAARIAPLLRGRGVKRRSGGG